jgi:hypothetical protein
LHQRAGQRGDQVHGGSWKRAGEHRAGRVRRKRAQAGPAVNGFFSLSLGFGPGLGYKGKITSHDRPGSAGPLLFFGEDSHVRKVRWLAALALVILIAPAVVLIKPVYAQEGGTKLTWKFEKDKTFYQTMTTTTDQTMTVQGSNIKQKQEQTFWFSWTPVKQDGDNWEIKQKIDGVKMRIEIGGTPIEYDSTKEGTTSTPLSDFFKQLVGSEFTLTVNKEFKVTKIEGRDNFLKKLTNSNPAMESLLKQILSEDALKEMADPTFAAVPNKEVKKGDTWPKESKLDMGPIGKYENKFKYTYEGPDKDKKDKISVETTLTYTAPDEKTAAGGLPFKIKSADLSSKNAKGTILFDAEKGRVDKSDMHVELSGSLNIDIGGQATSVNLTQKQDTTVTTSDTNPIKK